MTKEVRIRVTGLQRTDAGEPAQPIETVADGEYYYRNKRHYIRYEERQEGFEGKIINYIKISPAGLEMQKKGIVNVQMAFEKGRKTHSRYRTPFGELELDFFTTDIRIQEEAHQMHIRADYSMETGGAHVADCYIQIWVQSKNTKA